MDLLTLENCTVGESGNIALNVHKNVIYLFIKKCYFRSFPFMPSIMWKGSFFVQMVDIQFWKSFSFVVIIPRRGASCKNQKKTHSVCWLLVCCLVISALSLWRHFERSVQPFQIYILTDYGVDECLDGEAAGTVIYFFIDTAVQCKDIRLYF